MKVLQVNLWVHGINTPLYGVYLRDLNSSKELLSLAKKDLFLKALIKKKQTLFKYHGNNPQGKV